MKADVQLQQDVIAELKCGPSVRAGRIGAGVQDGVLTLTGEAGSFAEKWAAKRAAQRVAGVKARAVAMDVKLSALGQRGDAGIAGSAKNVLHCTACLPTDGVKLVVEAGWITSSGEADWPYQKEVAADALRYPGGVAAPGAAPAQIGVPKDPLLKHETAPKVDRYALRVQGEPNDLAQTQTQTPSMLAHATAATTVAAIPAVA